MAIMKYDSGKGEFTNWLVEESAFDERYLGKCEAIFCQGNGYIGLRSALEEEYVGETRNLFVTGTFNKFDENEVTELPNMPDMTKIVLMIDGKRFCMTDGILHDYHRVLNLKNGEVIRTVLWESPEGKKVSFEFKHMTSMDNEHVMVSKVTIRPEADIDLKVISGIDGRVSNSGSQHFAEGKRRIYDYKYLEMISETTQSKVTAALHCAHKFTVNGHTAKPSLLPIIARREIKLSAEIQVKAGEAFCVEKFSTVHTTRDLAYRNAGSAEALEALKNDSKQMIMKIYESDYETLLEESTAVWQKIWEREDILIDSENPIDQLAMRFAIYHLNIMVKKDDNRVGIGAKAMSGEGYKGHSFWDTEVFILPYYMMTQPNTAKMLLEYRYNTLDGARRKAKENGYEGAMYPWESAWIDDGEVTPLWGEADVVTGETLPILTGLIEQHISADVSFAVWQYYNATQDEDFMNRCGYEIIMDTARFWASRLEWNEALERYEINDVIGPDEYSEHVNNNAYTNYLAAYNMKLAVTLMDGLASGSETQKAIFERLNQALDLDRTKKLIQERLPKVYLPKPDEMTGIVPQFDGYFDLKEIDLKKYKESTVVGTIYKDYNMEQISAMQVLKQSDLVVLMYLLDDLFDGETKKKNYFYYETRTLHDSSLSKSTHSVLANDLGLHDEAYAFFKGASTVDLGEEMRSSNAGIHSASMGGVWQSTVLGFGGVRIVDGKLRIAPSLPKQWKKLEFNIVWRQATLHVLVTQNEVTVTAVDKDAEFTLGKESVTLKKGDCVTKAVAV